MGPPHPVKGPCQTRDCSRGWSKGVRAFPISFSLGGVLLRAFEKERYFSARKRLRCWVLAVGPSEDSSASGLPASGPA